MTWGAYSVSRSGNFMQLSLQGALKSSYGTWQNIALGTVSPAPSSLVYNCAFSNDSIVRYVQIETSGAVVLRTLAKTVDTGDSRAFRGSWLFMLS